jgi:mannose-1-phosphate guanylyltransferase/mannose-6-phosphate isomerase
MGARGDRAFVRRFLESPSMLVAVILSGGSGSRLWPVSRETSPKPFMRLAGGPSLLQRTVMRAKHAGVDEALIVTNKEYRFRTQEDLAQLSDTDRPARITLVLEPTARNTAPAIGAAAALVARTRGNDAVLLVLPADHLIQDEAAFAVCVARAQSAAASGQLVLFGIRPTMPATAFGYIETSAARASAAPSAERSALPVHRFIEKPDAERAAHFLAAGNYFWNSGMFAFTAGTLLDELRAHAPDVLQAVTAALPQDTSAATIDLEAAAFAAAPGISLDYAVMEKSRHIVVVPSEFGWSDIGSWDAVAAVCKTDALGNSSSGDVIFADCTNTHVQGDDRLIAAVALNDVIVVDTTDALLVCDRGATQQVKEVVAELQRRGHAAQKLHRTVARPWGSYTLLQEGARFKIKRIEVKPRAALSMQMHHHRSEHWIVVSGTAKVTIDGHEALVAPNESTYVPVGATHRLENPGKVALVMIEVQCGDYVGEDDIVRLDDQYGHVKVA